LPIFIDNLEVRINSCELFYFEIHQITTSGTNEY